MAVFEGNFYLGTKSLRADMRVKQYLNDILVRVGHIEGVALVPVFLDRFNNGDAGLKHSLIDLFYGPWALHNKAEMIQRLVRSGAHRSSVPLRDFVECKVIVSGRQVNIFRVRFPDDLHSQEPLIKGSAAVHVYHAKGQMPEAEKRIGKGDVFR